MAKITGIHHVTAFAGSPQRTKNFYTETLGLRMVKKTVNFDDPFTYHLYFGDQRGSPGTLLTHFPDSRARRGALGTGAEIADIFLATSDLSPWRAHLKSRNSNFNESQFFGHETLGFTDADGMRFQLIQEDRTDLSRQTAHAGPESPIVGVSAVMLAVPQVEQTAQFLESQLGFIRGRSADDAIEMFVGENASGQRLFVRRSRGSGRVPMGAGSVHHVAWRVPDSDVQEQLRTSLEKGGVRVTPIIDRSYFHSIYFQIPGGLIFEVATDGPGFCTDESMEKLGEALRLPPQHEHLRHELERTLEPLE